MLDNASVVRLCDDSVTVRIDRTQQQQQQQQQQQRKDDKGEGKDRQELEELLVLPSDISVNALGTSPARLIAALPAYAADSTDLNEVSKESHCPGGRLLTRSTLQLLRPEHADVFAIGDCASVTTVPGDGPWGGAGGTSYQSAGVPATAQAVQQQAHIVSDNVLAMLIYKHLPIDQRVKKLRNFHFVELGEIVSLGPFRAACSVLFGWLFIGGLLGGLLKRVVYSYRMPTWKQMGVALMSALSAVLKKVRQIDYLVTKSDTLKRCIRLNVCRHF